MKAVAEKDVTKTVLLVDDSKIEEKNSLVPSSNIEELFVDKIGDKRISGDTEVDEKKKMIVEKWFQLKSLNLTRRL